MSHFSRQTDKTPIELRTHPGTFGVRQAGVGSSLFMAQVVTGIQVDGELPITWGPVSKHKRTGATETRTIHLPQVMVGRMTNFVLEYLIEDGGQSYNCYDFANVLNGWSRTQEVTVAREPDQTAPEMIQNGVTYWVKSPESELITGDPFAHALVGVGQNSSINVVGPSRNGLGEIVLADASELLRVFGGVALLDVKVDQ